MNTKTILKDASIEDQKIFSTGLQKLLDDNFLVANLVINKKPISIKLDNGTAETGFIDSPTILLQKKVEQEVTAVK